MRAIRPIAWLSRVMRAGRSCGCRLFLPISFDTGGPQLTATALSPPAKFRLRSAASKSAPPPVVSSCVQNQMLECKRRFSWCIALAYARALPKRGRSPRAPTEHFTRKRFKISQVIPGRFPTCPSVRSGFSLAAPRARGAIASRQIVQA